jgi:hypothetical protein
MKILCLLRDQQSHVSPLVDKMKGEAGFVIDSSWTEEIVASVAPDLVLCVNDVSYEISKCIDMAKKLGIPSLVLQDGTLEWRCQYMNPNFGAGGGPPQHQPVLADKIACLGGQSTRHLAAWGNADKVEITGMPKMDAVLERPLTPLASSLPKRILVMTAKKPWFDDVQKEVVLRSLFDIRDHLMARKDVEVIWRVTKNLKDILNVTNRLSEVESSELVEIVDSVDLVISTPSTAILEAMLRDRPVVALDYHNTPRFLQTAWTISADSHIKKNIDDALNPSLAKLSFQRVCLSDSLRCDGSATERVAHLIRRMVEIGRDCRSKGKSLSLPARIVGDSGGHSSSEPFPLGLAYSDQTVFETVDQVALKARLARAEKDLQKLRAELVSRKIGYWISAAGRLLAKQVSSRK